jgi:hypothetical protein
VKPELTGQDIQIESTISTLPTAFSIVSGHALESEVVELIPPLDELKNMTLEVGLKLKNILLGENVRNNFAFTCMFGAITGVEHAASYRDEGIIKVGFQSTVSVTVDGVQGLRVGDGDVVGSNANDRTCFATKLAS